MNFLRWVFKELLKQKALQLLFSAVIATGLGFLGWLFNLLGVQIEMEKTAIIASMFLSASMPLIILFVVVFSVCMITFAILKRVLPSQRFASDAKKILTTLNLVREHIDSTLLKKASSPFPVFQSIENLKNTVLREHGISYPLITPEDENYFVVWFGVLSNLHGLAVNADLKASQHMRYDRIYREK